MPVPRTTALYTHVSTKLISQIQSPLDLLVASHGAKAQDEEKPAP